MSRRERIDALLEHNKREFEALKNEAIDEIGRAEDEANQKEDRYYSAVEELAKVEKKIASATAEREELVDRFPRAELDEEYAMGDELKERYKNLGRALEAWEKQRDSLKREIAELLPRPRGHRQDARIQALASATSAASAVRKDMEYLKDGLTEALSAAVGPVVQEHTDLLAETQQLGLKREWDLFEVGMGPRPATPGWSS